MYEIKSKQYSDFDGEPKKSYNKGEPYFCTKCNRAWQYLGESKNMDYLNDFPRVGCNVRNCRECKCL